VRKAIVASIGLDVDRAHMSIGTAHGHMLISTKHQPAFIVRGASGHAYSHTAHLPQSPKLTRRQADYLATSRRGNGSITVIAPIPNRQPLGGMTRARGKSFRA
jgi:hypothetical protein